MASIEIEKAKLELHTKQLEQKEAIDTEKRKEKRKIEIEKLKNSDLNLQASMSPESPPQPEPQEPVYDGVQEENNDLTSLDYLSKQIQFNEKDWAAKPFWYKQMVLEANLTHKTVNVGSDSSSNSSSGRATACSPVPTLCGSTGSQTPTTVRRTRAETVVLRRGRDSEFTQNLERMFTKPPIRRTNTVMLDNNGVSETEYQRSNSGFTKVTDDGFVVSTRPRLLTARRSVMSLRRQKTTMK